MSSTAQSVTDAVPGSGVDDQAPLTKRVRTKRGRLNMEKCERCRSDKKKCHPEGRDPSRKCDRCQDLEFECSPSTRKKRCHSVPSAKATNGDQHISADSLIPGPLKQKEPWHTKLVRIAHHARLEAATANTLLGFASDTNRRFPGSNIADGTCLFGNGKGRVMHKKFCLPTTILQETRQVLNSIKGCGDAAHVLGLNLVLREHLLLLHPFPFNGAPISVLPKGESEALQLIKLFSESQDFGGAFSMLIMLADQLLPSQFIQTYQDVVANLRHSAEKALGSTHEDSHSWHRNPFFFPRGIWYKAFDGADPLDHRPWDLADMCGTETIPQLSTFRDCTESTILHDLVEGFSGYCAKLKSHGALKLGEKTVEDWVWQKIKPVLENIANDTGINSQDITGSTPLHLATKQNYVPMMTWLIRAGADVNAKTVYSHTALHYVCATKNAAACTLLVTNGAAADNLDFRNRSPGYFALQNGFGQTFDACVSHSAKLNFMALQDNQNTGENDSEQQQVNGSGVTLPNGSQKQQGHRSSAASPQNQQANTSSAASPNGSQKHQGHRSSAASPQNQQANTSKATLPNVSQHRPVNGSSAASPTGASAIAHGLNMARLWFGPQYQPVNRFNATSANNSQYQHLNSLNTAQQMNMFRQFGRGI